MSEQQIGTRGVGEEIGLDDKYRLEAGTIYLSGIQALVRLPLIQAARDASQGLDTAGFVSGYRGSPLAGLDQQLWRARALLEQRQIRFLPGVNEELAATAVWGSQQLGLHPGARHQGVFGMWYGKAPGVDRASDALRHANAAGTSPHGGVLAICGDDHACKSSSYPSQSEYALMHLEMPVLSPSSVQEVLDYGLLGWGLSRYAGCWVGMIALADVMDSSAVVRVSPELPQLVHPESSPLPAGGLHIRSHDDPKQQEIRLREFKLPMALAFARANRVNRCIFDTPDPRLVVVATGKAYSDCRQALHDLGIDEEKAREIGLRLVKVGMPWPLDPVDLRTFCRGAERVLVVEEKRPVVESQLKEILYELSDDQRPRVVGKRDAHGKPLLSEVGELDSVEIAHAIALQLPAGVSTDRVDDHLAALAAGDAIDFPIKSEIQRIPYFCSGCPHNRSTLVPEGSRALVGIGCHYMVQWMDRDSDHFSQMGGEGVAWLGQAPFTDEEHLFANLGDGTYFHSGILAIRAAVAAGARITYKLLYNHAVAMTGGQSVDDVLNVPQITRQLAAEGVAEIVIVAEEPERYRGGEGLAPDVTVEPRTNLDAVQRRLRDSEGVTILIYDQGCAAEKRRKRKRGLLEDPDRRVFINERVCEGCGDCSTASNCLSVEPVETDFGVKRRINQSSCNKDFTCLEGSCPAMVTVHGGRLRGRAAVDLGTLLEDLPAPLAKRGGAGADETYNIVVAGIGGTGVTTAAALLGMAAHIEGRASGVLDMTGLAQKGGAVVSHVRIGSDPECIHGTRVPQLSADLLLGADVVVAASDPVMGVVHPGRTRCVSNSHFAPTAASIGRPEPLGSERLLNRIGGTSRVLHAVDATGLCEQALGDAIGSNLFLLGHAYQRGLIPLALDSIESAIALNGVSLDMNRRAFALGRLSAHDPKRLDELLGRADEAAPPESLDDFMAGRVRDLTRYQDARYAERYRALVERARAVEVERVGSGERLAWAVARHAHRLMAYKDEYEVARLHAGGAAESGGGLLAQIQREFEGDFRVELQLAPPLFASRDASTGRLVKRSFGPWMLRVMAGLAKLRFLRGTPFDPFGRLAERRLERRLWQEYHATLDELLDRLDRENHDLVCRIAELPESIRGFDRIKLRSAEEVERRRDALMHELGPAPGG